jgi:hypothetical protein
MHPLGQPVTAKWCNGSTVDFESISLGSNPSLASRDVAQSGRAPALGAGSRRFKSCHPDQIAYIPQHIACVHYSIVL